MILSFFLNIQCILWKKGERNGLLYILINFELFFVISSISLKCLILSITIDKLHSHKSWKLNEIQDITITNPVITIFHHFSLKIKFSSVERVQPNRPISWETDGISRVSTLSRIERFSTSGKRLFSQELRADGTAKEKEREEDSRLGQPSKNLEDRGWPLQDVAHRFSVRETEILSPEGNKGAEREKNARG